MESCSSAFVVEEFLFEPPNGPKVIVKAHRAQTATNHRIADGDQTGEIPWAAMPILCYYLLSPVGHTLLANSSVIELGAGVGVPGIIAARSCASLTLTDFNPVVLDLLRATLTLNVVPPSTQVLPLAWGRDNVPQGMKAQVLLGSDLVYSVDCVTKLLETVNGLLDADQEAVLILSYVSRWPRVDQALAYGARAAGFVISPQDLQVFLPPCATEPNAALYLIRRASDSPRSIAAADWTWDAPRDSWTLPPHAVSERSLQAHPDRRGLVLRGRAADVLAPAQTQLLGDCLGTWLGLTKVDLWGNFLGLEGAQAIAEGISACSGLQELCLGRNALGPEGSRALRIALRPLVGLRVLNVAENGLGDSGAAELATVLPPAIRKVLWASNGIGDEGAGALADALRSCPDLSVLDLSVNDVGPTGALGLFNSLRDCSRLQCLDLNINRIGSDGLLWLAEGLPHYKALRILRLRANFLQDWAVRYFAEALPQCPVQILELGSNNLHDAAAVALGGQLAMCRELTELDLARNAIGNNGAQAIAQALPDCCCLSKLRLQGNRIGPRGVDALGAYSPSLDCSMSIDVSGNEEDSEDEEEEDQEDKEDEEDEENEEDG